MDTIIKTATLSLLCAFCLPLCAQQAHPDENPYLFLAGEADKAISEGDYDTALSRLTAAIKLRPDDPETVLLISNLGLVYSYMGQDSLALVTFDDAIRKAPSMKVLQTNRANVLINLGRKAEAYADLTKIIEADSANVEARYLHGVLSLGLSDFDSAEADLRVLVDVDPESLRTAVAMSWLLSAQGRYKEATPYLERLVEESGEAEDYAALANNYIDQGMLSEAGTAVAQGLAKYPDSGELYFSRALLNKARYSLDDAAADARKAASLGIEKARIRAAGL